MNTKEARKLLKENFDEISFNEFSHSEGELILVSPNGLVDLYFKPKEKFPKVFESENKQLLIKVYKNGEIEFIKLPIILEAEELIILDQAIKLSQEIRGVK